MKFYGLFSVVGRISGRCSGISAVEAPSLPHRDYKYTKFSKKTSIAALSPPKKHPSRPQRRPPTGRKLRSTPSPSQRSLPAASCGARRGASRRAGLHHYRTFALSDRNPPAPPTRSLSKPSSRDHPAAACGAHPAPTNETTRPQPAEHAAAQADERASAGGGCGPRDSSESHPFHSATPSNPPQPRPPAARLLLPARRARDTPGLPAKRPAHRIPLHVTPRHDEAGAAPQSDTGPYPFRKALPATAASGSPAAVRPAPSIPTPSGNRRQRPPPSATVRRPPPAPRR